MDGKLAVRTYDHGTEDPLDPVYNAGDAVIFATCPNYLDSPMVELGTVLASASTCEVGDSVRVSVTYNGKTLKPVTITVTEKAIDPVDGETTDFPWLYVGIGAGAAVLIAAAVIVVLIIKKKKRT